MSRNFYIISNSRINGEYKVGYHKHDIRSLYKRYTTAIPNVVVEYFIKDVDSRRVERLVLDRHKESRIKIGHTGRASEWISIQLDVLLNNTLEIMTHSDLGLDNTGNFCIMGYENYITEYTNVIRACRISSQYISQGEI